MLSLCYILVVKSNTVSRACILCFQLAKSHGNVFATDAILATLMCCNRSVYSWDIVVQRVGKKLFFDKRDDSEFGKPSQSQRLLNIVLQALPLDMID